jgi:branched-chain amino acid aminotransferase
MSKKICFKNGEYLKESEMTVSAWDLGYLRGYGVFDVLPVMNGKAFLWEWHFERLFRSANKLGLSLPLGKDEYGNVLQELIAKNEGRDIVFRTVLSGGVSTDAFTPVSGNETFLILTEDFHHVSEEARNHGATVITHDHVRSFPEVKMTHYVSAIGTLEARREQGALETLYVQDGVVSECAQSNFFIVSNGRVITTNENALLGITQKLIVEKLAPEKNIEIEVRKITLTEVLNADEAFLTGSNKGVVPVIQVDEQQIGEGMPGPVTKMLIEAYKDFVKNY